VTTAQQDRLIDYAAHHYVRAEPREEGDVAVFCECTVPCADGSRRLACEIDCVSTMGELRAVLGY
jgi:hypothetical protein